MSTEQTGEVQTPTDTDRINAVYDELRLDDSLTMYALSHYQDTALTADIEHSIDKFGQAVSAIASTEGGIDIDLVRGAFGRFYEGMEKAADAKLGPDIIRPYTLSQLVLTKLGIRKPTYRQRFSQLNDQYWDSQFMKQYKEQTWVKRVPDETEQEYAGRYIGSCLRSFPWAMFSYI